MPDPCPQISLVIPDDRVILVSSEEDGLIISNTDPQTITSVSSLAWQTWDPANSWTLASAVNHSRYLRVGKFFIFQICYVFNVGPSFTDTTFTFGPVDELTTGPGEFLTDGDLISEMMVAGESCYWSALDASSSQVIEGQICLSSGNGVAGKTPHLIFRTGDDAGSSNSILGTATLAWATGDKIMGSGIVELV